MRTEIEKQQTKRTIIHFSFQEREKKEKLILAAHPGRRRMAKFSHRVASHAPLEWRGRRPLAGACGTRASDLSNKKSKSKCENTKTLPIVLLIIQNTHMKIPKYPKDIRLK
jgi:hypothetical protein